MRRALDEMSRRRKLQQAYNAEHGLTPVSIHKSVEQVRFTTRVADAREGKREPAVGRVAEPKPDRETMIAALDDQMREAAAQLDFELAALLRDQLFELRTEGDGERRVPRGVHTSAAGHS